MAWSTRSTRLVVNRGGGGAIADTAPVCRTTGAFALNRCADMGRVHGALARAWLQRVHQEKVQVGDERRADEAPGG